MFTQKYTKILEATSYHEDPKENPLTMRTLDRAGARFRSEDRHVVRTLGRMIALM